MKTIKKSLFVYVTGFILSVVFYSCCTHNYRIIEGGSLRVYDLSNKRIDTINNTFYLGISVRLEQIVGIDHFGLIQNTYATSCSHELENDIVDSSIILKCNRPFQYKNETIKQNSDFFGIEELRYLFDWEYGWGRIFFEESFLTNAQFEVGEYVFTIEMETDDGLRLANEVTVQIEL